MQSISLGQHSPFEKENKRNMHNWRDLEHQEKKSFNSEQSVINCDREMLTTLLAELVQTNFRMIDK